MSKTIALFSVGEPDPFYGPRWPQRLDVIGGDAIAYGIHTVPAGQEQRRTTGGPMVPGPWASLYGHPTVISNPPQPYEPGLRVEPGDVLILDGERYTVALSKGIGYGSRGWIRRGYPILLSDDEVQS